MADLKLFDVPVQVSETCRHCVHRFTYSYTHTTISYCNMQKSNHTENGKKKIRAKDPACPMFEKSTEIKRRKIYKPV